MKRRSGRKPGLRVLIPIGYFYVHGTVNSKEQLLNYKQSGTITKMIEAYDWLKRARRKTTFKRTETSSEE